MKALGGGAFLVAVITLSASGQVVIRPATTDQKAEATSYASKWQRILESLGRQVPPTVLGYPGYRGCDFAIVGPDSLAFVGRGTVLSAAEPVAQRSLSASQRILHAIGADDVDKTAKGNFVPQPGETLVDATPDTLRARFVDAWCKDNRVELLVVESHDRFLAIALSGNIPSVGDDTQRFENVINDGKILPLYMSRRCEEDCRTYLVPITALRDSLRGAVEKTSEARADSIRTIAKAQKWTSGQLTAVLGNGVELGMTSDMVRASWGEPEKINRTLTNNGSTDQWVFQTDYVYFSRGRVTSIQTASH